MNKLKEITITTPEKIYFTYRIADFGTRVAAYTIDLIFQWILVFLIILLLIAVNLITPGSFQDIEKNSAGYMIYAFYLLLIFFLKWFYFVVFEIITEGQSPGKKLMKIRVIKEDGSSLDFHSIILRNFLRAVDGFPVYPLLGGFIALIDKKGRRLGEMVSNTIVVYEIQFNLTVPDFEVSFSNKAQLAYKNNITGKLTENDLYILRRFLNEKYKLPPEKENDIANKLANELKIKLGLSERIEKPVQFIEEIYKQHGI